MNSQEHNTSRFTVLGSGGFIGSHLCRYLRSRGHDVLAFGRHDWPRSDLSSGCVIYCVGLTADFRQRPFDTFDAHVGRLAEALRLRFDSFTYLSSTRVYARAVESVEDAPIPVCPSDPSDLYNISKLAGESLCLTQPNPQVRVLRLSNVYGLEASPTTFLASVIRDAIRGRLRLETSMDSAKDYVAVEDVVSAIESTTRGDSRTYNIASGHNVSNREIVDTIVRTLGCQALVSESADTVAFPRISIDRMKAEFNYAPRDMIRDLPALIDSYAKVNI